MGSGSKAVKTLALSSTMYCGVGGMLLQISRVSISPALKKGYYNIYLGQGLLIVISLGDGKNVLKLDYAVVAQLWKYTKNHLITHFKGVTLWNANCISLVSALSSQL